MNMDVNAARPLVRDVVTEIVGRRVQDSEPIVSSGLVDSLTVLQLIVQLEGKLNVAIPPANLQPDDFDSVDMILDTLQRVAQ
jgi:acyl carrier protein